MVLDGIPQSDPLPCRLPQDLVEACAAEEAERKQRAWAETARIHAEFAEQCQREADRVLEITIQSRAERVERHPWLLDNFWPGLSVAHPTAALARIDILIERARSGETFRWRGFGGESPEISLLAAQRYFERELMQINLEAAE